MIELGTIGNIKFYLDTRFGRFKVLHPSWRPDMGYNHALSHDMTTIGRFDNRVDCDYFIARLFEAEA